jgi:hypothetical protein
MWGQQSTTAKLPRIAPPEHTVKSFHPFSTHPRNITMKTIIATIALSLVCAVSFAKSVERIDPQLAIEARTGTGPELAAPFMSTKTRADVAAELKAAPRLPAYVDGSAYEQAMAMFMSQRSAAEVRAEARMARSLNADLDSLYRN